MAKIRCPYTYPHKSRSAMIDYITGIGGYSSRDGYWPIEFNVATYHADFSFDHIWEKYHAEHISDATRNHPPSWAAYYRLAQKLYEEHKDYLWEWGQEDAYRSLKDSDTYKMLWDGTAVGAELELHGRGGKHLVIAMFNGYDFNRCSTDNLKQSLRFGEDGCAMPMNDLRLLYKYVRQCEVDFTPEKASAEVEYQGAFCFFANIVMPEWEEKVKLSGGALKG